MNIQFSSSCIPHVQSWLAERHHASTDTDAIMHILTQSLQSYVETYQRFPFYPQHEVHLIPALSLRRGSNTQELHLPAKRSPSGDWTIGTTSDFEPSDAYHLQRITEEVESVFSPKPKAGS